MRLGWDHSSLNAPELARRAEKAGVRLVTVHGRTRCQFYGGAADWAAIRRVKEAVGIPVIANGDFLSVDDVEPMLAASGADGIMVGRGAYGRPWFPGHVAAYSASGVQPGPPRGRALAALVQRHYLAMLGHYGESLGARCARKHLGWYADRLPRGGGAAATIRTALLTEGRPKEVLRLIPLLICEQETEGLAA